MPQRLIINADDFGLTPGINRAVVELYRAGCVTSATLMATGPAFADAVELLHGNPGLGVGCHLVFVDGIPVSHPESIPSLLGADGKTFRPSLADFAQAVLRGTISANELARETQAQIQKLQRAGIDVTHVDTHKHTHCLPAIAKTVLHIAERCGVPAMRNPFEPAWAIALSQEIPLLRRLQLACMRRAQPAFNVTSRHAAERGLIPSGTLGIAATGKLSATVLRELIDAILTEAGEECVWELCCHPGYLDEALSLQPTRLRASREEEIWALAEVFPAIRAHRFAPELIHYGQLGVAGLQRAAGQFARHTGFEKVM